LSRRFALLVNPASAGGKALKALPAVHEALDRLGAPHRTVTTRSSEHAAEEAAKAASNGETVAALSGDGMLRPLATALKGTPGTLAIVPCGRGNDLARVLGIPTDPAAAAELAVTGPEKLLDVANVDGNPYVGIASFGFDSEANRIANETRHEYAGYSVAVGNSKAYGGGMIVLPEAELDDGKLDVLVSKEASKLTFLRGVFDTFKAAHVDSPNAEFLRGTTIEVGSDRPFVIYGDGDPIGTTPATMRVEPRCLRVIVPA
jgi:diacylglycerol kinase family enzyme